MSEPSGRPQETKPVDAPLVFTDRLSFNLPHKLLLDLHAYYLTDQDKREATRQPMQSFDAWLTNALTSFLEIQYQQGIDPGIVLEQEEHNREEEGGLCD